VGAAGTNIVDARCYVADQLDATALAEVAVEVSQREMSAEALANVTGRVELKSSTRLQKSAETTSIRPT
jgi:hypothetical protein